jgi:hypothetical protein
MRHYARFKLVILTSIVFKFIPAFSQEIDSEVILKHTVCKIENNKLIIENQLKIAIYNRKGEDNIHFAIPYNDKRTIKNLSGHITDLSGKTVRKLSKKQIKDVSDISEFSLYEDDYKKTFTLKHNQYPYTIHLNYTRILDEYMHIIRWTPFHKSKYPTRKGILEIILPSNKKIQIKEINISQKPKISENENTKHYLWEINNTKEFKKENFSPPAYAIIPKIIIKPEEFTYEIHGKQDSWRNFGQWVYDLTSGQNDLPKSEKIIIDTLLKDCRNNKEKVNRLYNYLQDNTRYISVQLGIGGFKPFPASYVAEKKYGDCKALSNYMMSMLQYAGIKSHYITIYHDDNIPELSIDFPSQQFNHVVVLVPFENDSTWLECTSDNIPAGYVGKNIHNRSALLIEKDKSQLVKTPALSNHDVLTVRKFYFKLYTENKDEVRIEYKKRGPGFEYFSSISKDTDIKTQKEILERMHYFFPDKEIIDFLFQRESLDSASIELFIDMKINSQIKKYGNDFVCPVIGMPVPDFELPSKRKLPVWINSPKHIVDTFLYQPPSTLQTSTIPKNDSISSKYGVYTVECKKDSDKVVFVRTFQLNSGKYSIEEYPGFYAFIQSIKKLERKNIITLVQ